MAPRVRRLGLCARAGLAAGALAVAAVGVGPSGAAFSDSWTHDWQISSGSVALVVDGAALSLDAGALAPGDVATATARLRVGGSLPVHVSLTRAELASVAPHGCALRDALDVRIVKDRDGDPATGGDRGVIVDVPLAAVPARLDLGVLEPGAVRSYAVTVTFAPQHGATDEDNDNCFQGAVARERFDWDAEEDRP